MIASFRKTFFPTKEETEKQKEFLIKIHKESAKKCGCTTCANCIQVRHYPDFVTGEECECSVGLKCDTVLDRVRNCKKYVEYDIEKDLNWETKNEFNN